MATAIAMWVLAALTAATALASAAPKKGTTLIKNPNVVTDRLDVSARIDIVI